MENTKTKRTVRITLFAFVFLQILEIWNSIKLSGSRYYFLFLSWVDKMSPAGREVQCFQIDQLYIHQRTSKTRLILKRTRKRKPRMTKTSLCSTNPLNNRVLMQEKLSIFCLDSLHKPPKNLNTVQNTGVIEKNFT